MPATMDAVSSSACPVTPAAAVGFLGDVEMHAAVPCLNYCLNRYIASPLVQSLDEE